MNLRMNLIVQLILVIFVATFDNVSCKDNSNSRAKRLAQKSNNGDALYLTKLLQARVPVDGIRAKAKVTLGQMSHIQSYAGYLTDYHFKQAHFFFWYFPAKVHPEKAPVVLYLEGALHKDMFFGILEQNGPFSIASNGSLVERKESWNNKHNVIYMDSLLQTGFSFMTTRFNYFDPALAMGSCLCEVLQQFFRIFPSVRKNDLFVMGSYFAGKLALRLGSLIAWRMNDLEPDDDDNMYLKGVGIVNGMIDPLMQLNFGEYLYTVGLIDDNGKSEFLAHENQIVGRRTRSSTYHLLESLILGEFSLFNNLTKYAHPFNILKYEPMLDTNRISNWVQSAEIRRALHVGNNRYEQFNTEALDYRKMELTSGGQQYFEDYLQWSGQHRLLIYTGNLDILCSYPAVNNYLHTLNWPAVKEFKTAERKPWLVSSGDFAGYKTKAGNLIEVLVRNAGHFISIDQPQWTLELLESFTDGSLQ